jgi:hypothetical protein
MGNAQWIPAVARQKIDGLMRQESDRLWGRRVERPDRPRQAAWTNRTKPDRQTGVY